jgi:4,5-DOPA dioxygenase extradiol
MYELSYNSPGNPVLAQQIATELQNKNINSILNNNQGLDHGAWVPLKIMFPEEIIPVIQISIPVPRDSYYLFKLGKILSKFRSKNILFMGSGNLVHNIPYAMRQVQFGKIDLFSENNPIENWARETDEWLKLNLDEKNVDSLLRSSEIAPNFKLAAPSTEHFDPLYFILGTMNDSESISYIHEGFQAGSFSMRSFSISNS